MSDDERAFLAGIAAHLLSLVFAGWLDETHPHDGGGQ